LTQWAVGDLSGGRDVKDIQPDTTLHRGFLAILFVKVKWYLLINFSSVEEHPRY
jgi:hypothetical protein